ncbi:hypothetical protein KYD79_27160, partial [Escherichia coli]|nr:hypothetical protein [Escherichia coli]
TLLPKLVWSWEIVNSLVFADLRDDKQFFIDHPGAVPITTNQVLKSLNGYTFHDYQFLMKYGLMLC